MPQMQKVNKKVASVGPAATDQVIANLAAQNEMEESMVEKEKLQGTESVLEAVERFVAQDKLLAESEEEDEYYDDEEEDEEWSEDEAAEGNEPTVSVKEVVQKINEIAIKTVEQGAMEIGAYVLTAVFNDDLGAVLSVNPYKSASLEQICKDPDLMVDRRRLGTWVRAAALRKDLQEKELECSNLTCTHFLALLRLRDQEKRQNLAIEANRDRLTVRQILTRIEEMKKPNDSSKKRKEIFKKIEEPLKLLSDKDTKELLSDQERLAREFETRERLDLVTVIDRIGAQMDETRKFLKQVKNKLVRIELADCEVAED